MALPVSLSQKIRDNVFLLNKLWKNLERNFPFKKGYFMLIQQFRFTV